MLPGILPIGGTAVGIAILTSPLWLEYMEMDNWRIYKPFHLFKKIDEIETKRLE